jgi:phytoene desaturase (3,4-didehydrolycopene-forming)
MVDKAREAVLTTVEQRTGASIRSHITKEILNTPASWKTEFNLDKGAILGLSHSFFNVLSFRPSTRHASIKDLYFVGASTHPGTGVPIVLAGSKMTTGQILDDLRMEKPWTTGAHTTRKVSRNLDTQLSRSFDLLNVLICLMVVMLVAGCYTIYR